MKTEAESGLRHLRAKECQGPLPTPEAKRKAWNRSSPTAFRRSSSASREAKQKDGAEEKQEPFRKGGAPLGCRDTGAHWCTLAYQGQSQAVTGNDGRKIGSNQPGQGISALRGV